MKHVQVRLACDGCGTERDAQFGASLDDLRQLLAQVGWLSDKANDRDACPTCIASGRVVSA